MIDVESVNLLFLSFPMSLFWEIFLSKFMLIPLNGEHTLNLQGFFLTRESNFY